MIDPISTTASLTASATTAARPVSQAAETARAFANDLARAEGVAAQGLVGQVGAREVAETVMQAERSLQTAIAVRDKIVSSFLEISRMAI